MHLIHVLLLAVLLPASGPETVITKDGKRFIGKVTRDGKTILVETSVETLKIDSDTVLIIFETPKDALTVGQSRFEQAKKIYAEAVEMGEKNPLRRQRLGIALDVCKNTRDLIEILCRYYANTPEYNAFLDLMRTIPQFMRLIRDSMGSALAGTLGTGASKETVGLESNSFAFSAPAAPDRPWIFSGDLGSGQGSMIEKLADEKSSVREEAAKFLTSPPAPHALPALLKQLEKETEDKCLQAIVDAAWRLDVEGQFKTGFAWGRKETDVKRRCAVALLCKRLSTKVACEFLAEGLRETPPTSYVVRGALCSAFRKMRAFADDELKDALSKAKERPAMAECLKQIAMLRDPKLAPILRNAMVVYSPTPVMKSLWGYAYFGLEVIGKAAVPAIIDGMTGNTDDVRRCCKALGRRLTGENYENAAEFGKWWQRMHRDVEQEEENFWKDQAVKGYPVNGDEFKIFDRKFDEAK